MVEFSEPGHMTGWKLWEWAKGRKRTIITFVVSGVGYFIMDQNLVGIIAGPVFESVWAIIAYWYSRVEIKS